MKAWTTNFQAICVRCGKQDNATSAHEDGWRLLFQPGRGGALVNAVCWRCDREQRAAAMPPYRSEATA